MANIATGSFRLYAREGWQQAHLSRQRLFKTFFEGWFGMSYHVPAWSRHISPCIIELQGGFKNCVNYGLNRVWTRFGEHLEAIWVREYIGDNDSLYRLDHQEGYYGEGPCRYGCDRVEIHWSPEAPLHLQSQRIFFVRGFYLGMNDRSFGSADNGGPPVMRTPTTPTLAHQIRRDHRFGWPEVEVGETLPPDLVALESEIGKFATRVEFFWQKRLVQCCVLWKRIWLRYFLDYWDNCVDEEWLRWKDEHH